MLSSVLHVTFFPETTFRDLVEPMQTEGEVRVARVILEDPTVGSGATVHPQTGVIAPAYQGLGLVAFAVPLAQTGATGAELPEDVLTDAQVETQHDNIQPVDQQQTCRVVPGTRQY